jgi:hypothetical protein
VRCSQAFYKKSIIRKLSAWRFASLYIVRIYSLSHPLARIASGRIEGPARQTIDAIVLLLSKHFSRIAALARGTNAFPGAARFPGTARQAGAGRMSGYPEGGLTAAGLDSCKILDDTPANGWHMASR